MGINTQTITVDLSKQPTRPQVVRLGQGDRQGTTLVADIYDSGAAYNLNGKTARFSMRAPDGASSYSVAASSYSGNKATFNIDETYAASIAGKTDTAYIEVLSGSTVICSTSRITVIVLRSASQGLPVSGAYSDALIEAISSAQSAASSANSAASNANTKATRAENAATAANNAAGSANTAKDAANAAASAATTAAGSATTAAEAANSAKDAANAAATAANTAAGSANAATSEANAAIEAMGDISELAVPEMTSAIRGGAKVGGSTQVIGGKLEVKLSESANGTSVTTGSTSALRELQVHGRSVQNGTPTPDAPVPVQVVQGVNLLDVDSPAISSGKFIMSDGSLTNSASWNVSEYIPVSDSDYVLHGAGTGSAVCYALYDGSYELISAVSYSNRTTIQISATGASYLRVCFNTANEETAQLEKGSTPTPYLPYGSIGIVVGDTMTSIDLQGNTLASLPDGTHDELHVDSTGHVWIDKQVGVTVYSDSNYSGSWGDGTRRDVYTNIPSIGSDTLQYGRCLSNMFQTGREADYTMFIRGNGNVCFRFLASTGITTVEQARTLLADKTPTIYYPITPQTIDLGYIDPPAIPSGSVVTISASLTPTFDLACWTEHASELADMTATLANEISSLRSQIAALATS